jgi:hypothetical protein
VVAFVDFEHAISRKVKEARLCHSSNRIDGDGYTSLGREMLIKESVGGREHRPRKDGGRIHPLPAASFWNEHVNRMASLVAVAAR